MTSIPHLYTHIRTYGSSHSPLYSLSVLLFFLSIFDAVYSYIVPLILEQNNISPSMIGILIGSTSFFGALFDLVLFHIFREVRMRRLFLLTIFISLASILVFWYAHVLILYFTSMALWGLMYDLRNFGKYNFMAKYITKTEHGAAFGVTSVFENLGYFLGPLLAGAFLMGGIVQVGSLYLCIFFLFCSLLAYVAFFHVTVRSKSVQKQIHARRKITVTSALAFLQKDRTEILIPIMITVMICIVDAFYWTLGPLLESTYELTGYFVPVYMLPSLLIGWFVGKISLSLGKIRACYTALFIGGAVLATVPWWSSYGTLLAVVFFSSLCISIALPVAEALISDSISSHPSQEKTIETSMDFMTNVGWIIGPVIAGIAGELIGFMQAFSILGLLVCGFAVLLAFMPQPKIN